MHARRSHIHQQIVTLTVFVNRQLTVNRGVALSVAQNGESAHSKSRWRQRAVPAGRDKKNETFLQTLRGDKRNCRSPCAGKA
ncbi:hypothetical protein KCP73_17895 [Salmonella enterica subsp. enterica]|nr:hypothetical protein KCP73_17895 [Salmonella enterica subsp. enterica]